MRRDVMDKAQARRRLLKKKKVSSNTIKTDVEAEEEKV